jgi:Rap guanine nucleotide exchange factor 4
LVFFYFKNPSPILAKIGMSLRTLLLSGPTGCLKDRKVSGKLIKKCALGSELVDFLVNLSPVVHSRIQATGMWQALLEENVISHGKKPKS